LARARCPIPESISVNLGPTELGKFFRHDTPFSASDGHLPVHSSSHANPTVSCVIKAKPLIHWHAFRIAVSLFKGLSKHAIASEHVKAFLLFLKIVLSILISDLGCLLTN
jgi:hypothetical protein